MKKTLTLFLLLISISSFAGSHQALDTISNWQVCNGGKLLKAFNLASVDIRIFLSKGKIRAIDSVEVKYFDDTPCFDYVSNLTIRTKNNKVIKSIDNSIGTSNFKIRTTDLQMLAHKNRSSILKFYFKEKESDKEILLFEIKIR